jgi:E3 ubiquitin-protein ligase RNF115/126
MMAQYLHLLAFLGQGPTGRGIDPFTELFAGPEGGASSGRWGDYVFNQEGMYLLQPL